MKWCTVSVEEHQKCKWLSQVSLNYGIQPVLTCSESKGSKDECIQSISNKGSDIAVIESNYGYKAKRLVVNCSF